MICTRCGSTDLHRSRRNGMRDRIQMWFGRWPYRCEHCGLRFWAQGRYTPRPQEQWQTGRAGSTAASAAKEGPDMGFRTHAQKPQAKIIVQAESHEQLNHILLALNQAVHSHQQASKKQEQTASNFR